MGKEKEMRVLAPALTLTLTLSLVSVPGAGIEPAQPLLVTGF